MLLPGKGTIFHPGSTRRCVTIIVSSMQVHGHQDALCDGGMRYPLCHPPAIQEIQAFSALWVNDHWPSTGAVPLGHQNDVKDDYHAPKPPHHSVLLQAALGASQCIC